MITDISIGNFKCIAEATLRFGSLTLLAGLNGAGKSSVIQSMLSLRQSQKDGSLAGGHISFSGELVDLGTPSDVLHTAANDDVIRISLRDTSIYGNFLDFSYTVSDDRASAIDRFAHLSAFNAAAKSPSISLLLSMNMTEQSDGPTFHYLNAERVGPRKFGMMSATRGRHFDLGIHGEFAMHALHTHQGKVTFDRDDSRHLDPLSGRLLDQVVAWLAEISPGVRLALTPVDIADLMVGAFSFAEEGSLPSVDFRSTNVGFGLSYVLPVLVALLGSEKGSLVLLENPEAHIHPAGQTRLGELTAYAAAAGVQIIVETHSDHFMDGVRIAIRNGILSPEDAAFHYFKRTGIQSTVSSPNIDRNGKLEFWPDGFFDQHRRNTARLVKPVA
ncbi:DUF3696 domain-containing protein [Phyllobacterium sp. P30BS-XVII]|uniref:DUF3696 domain-containing protein n=1 Tax=Phyllobacterium sp. P30BS-XVII TaxID=2587046 RepID=UPI0015FCDA99|nr:DUF3696 domain-containing protein [Phyllobacterium sp. P30BS-XVII]MBA8904173.1 putative ATPase [Phyllobacterium sp. P30BS-XVII]